MHGHASRARKNQVRDVLAVVILLAAIVVGGVVGWRYASAHVVSARSIREASALASNPNEDLQTSGLTLDPALLESSWTLSAFQRIGIEETTAEKATVALYGGIAGGLAGLLLAFLLAEPLAVVLTPRTSRT